MKVLNWIREHDKFGIEIKLKYNKEDTHKTLIGGFLSILVMILTLCAAYLLLSVIYSKSDVDVSTSREYRPLPQMRNIIDLGYTFKFSMFKDGQLIPAVNLRKYITIKGRIMNRRYDPIRNVMSIFPSFEFNYTLCSMVQNTIQKKYIERISDPLAEQNVQMMQVCPDIKDSDIPKFVIGGIVDSSPNFTSVNLYVYPCISEPGVVCVPESEMTQMVSPVRIPRYTFNASNVTDPVTELDSYDQVLLDLQRTSYVNYTLQQEFIQDVSQFDYFATKDKAEYLEIEERRLDLTLRTPPTGVCPPNPSAPLGIGCQPLLVVTFNIGGVVYTRQRSFGKVLNTLGEVGGVSEVITICIGFIFMLYKCCHLSEDKIVRQGLYPDEEYEELLEFNKRYETGFDDKKFTKEVIGEAIEDNQDGFEIFRSTQKVKIMDAALMEEHLKVLMPLVLFRMKAKEVKLEKERKKKGCQIKVQGEKQKKRMTMEEAYEKLKNGEHDGSEISKKISKMFMEVLGEGIEGESEEPASKTKKKTGLFAFGSIDPNRPRKLEEDSKVFLNVHSRPLTENGEQGQQRTTMLSGRKIGLFNKI